jgi:hypothetical protein
MSKAKMSEFKLPFGLKDGRLVHVSDVEQGLACGCICPACKEALVARKGGVTTHHFAHHGGTSCERGLETAMHLAAKQILNESRTMALPEVKVGFHCYRNSLEITPEGMHAIDEVREEHRIDGTVPDMLVYRGTTPLLVEIRVTRAADDAKLQKIRGLGISALEIDLSSAPHSLSMETLTEIVVHGIGVKSWIFNAKAERYKLALLQAGERKSLLRRGMALHVDNCPINARVWKGKSYANVMDDCLYCRFALEVDLAGEGNSIICGGHHKIESLEQLKAFYTGRESHPQKPI